MKLLILVLSYNVEPYAQLMETQKETWASNGDIPTFFYYGNGGTSKPKLVYKGSAGKTTFLDIQLDFHDEYYEMHWKFKLALDRLSKSGYKWDLMFRTNSSSYVNKLHLQHFADTNLPLEKCYAGYTVKDTNDDGGDCVSGAGIFLSKDCCEILRQKLPEGPACEEDVLIGRILRKEGITAIDDRSRIDYPQEIGKDITSTYHIRFKTGDRVLDASNMKRVHKMITI